MIGPDPDDHTLEEPVKWYRDSGFDEEDAHAYAEVLKNPPPGFVA